MVYWGVSMLPLTSKQCSILLHDLGIVRSTFLAMNYRVKRFVASTRCNSRVAATVIRSIGRLQSWWLLTDRKEGSLTFLELNLLFYTSIIGWPAVTFASIVPIMSRDTRRFSCAPCSIEKQELILLSLNWQFVNLYMA